MNGGPEQLLFLLRTGAGKICRWHCVLGVALTVCKTRAKEQRPERLILPEAGAEGMVLNYQHKRREEKKSMS